MIQKMKQWKQKDNKGFTLVELIVVLVILAILAAILVPALLGYIDRAKNQQIVLNARSCYTAAQAELSSMYGTNVSPSAITDTTHKNSIFNTADVPSGSKLSIGTAKSASGHDAYTVIYVKYEENGKTVYFDGSSWIDTNPYDSNKHTKYDLGTKS